MSTLQCGELAENLQVPRRSPHERGKVPAVAAVTAGAAVDPPSSAIGRSCCGGAGGAEGACCQVTFRVVGMERWALSTRMLSRAWSILGPT